MKKGYKDRGTLAACLPLHSLSSRRESRLDSRRTKSGFRANGMQAVTLQLLDAAAPFIFLSLFGLRSLALVVPSRAASENSAD